MWNRDEFDREFKEFDRQVDRQMKLTQLGVVISVIISLSLCGFGLWVVVQLMQYFGVV